MAPAIRSRQIPAANGTWDQHFSPAIRQRKHFDIGTTGSRWHTIRREQYGLASRQELRERVNDFFAALEFCQFDRLSPAGRNPEYPGPPECCINVVVFTPAANGTRCIDNRHNVASLHGDLVHPVSRVENDPLSIVREERRAGGLSVWKLRGFVFPQTSCK